MLEGWNWVLIQKCLTAAYLADGDEDVDGLFASSCVRFLLLISTWRFVISRPRRLDRYCRWGSGNTFLWYISTKSCFSRWSKLTICAPVWNINDYEIWNDSPASNIRLTNWKYVRSQVVPRPFAIQTACTSRDLIIWPPRAPAWSKWHKHRHTVLYRIWNQGGTVVNYVN